MSHSATIDITFREPLPSVEAALTILLDARWRTDGFFRNGITYLPAGDRDAYNWQPEEPQNWPTVVAVVAEKERKQERIGIMLTFDETQGDFYFESPYTTLGILINNVGRKVVATRPWTDFRWYTQQITLPLAKHYPIGEVTYTDFP